MPRHRAAKPHACARSTVLGMLALVVAAVGAVAVGPGVSQAAGTGPGRVLPTELSRHLGPGDSLYARFLARPSRGDSRVAPGRSAVRVRVAAREAALASVAGRAKSYAAGLADDTWVLPTSHFHISTWFGEPGWYWSSGYHTGIDFVAPCGTPEVAVTTGRVVRAGWDGPYGYQVRLRLPNGDQVWYNHLTEIKTHVGATLGQGGLVGLMGETGNAYGCHLHLEYRLHADLKTAVDPAPFFAAHGIHLRALERARAAKG